MSRSRLVPDVVSSHPVGVALALTMAVGLLGGCSFGGTDSSAASTSAGPTVPASPIPTPAATPSPTTTPKPERPAAMDAVNLDGAIATAGYFLQLFPYALNTGDLTEWSLLSDVECQFCGGVADDVGNLSKLRQHQNGTEITIQVATGAEIRRGASFAVDITFTQGPWTVVDSAGTVVDTASTPEALHALVVVTHDADRWLIRAVQVDPANG
jgi:hypothetical protein